MKEFLQVLSSVEKRYGRSIVDIRRQIAVWEEMLSAEEILFSPSLRVGMDNHQMAVSSVALPIGSEFYSVFDVMKYIAKFVKYNVNLGLDLSNLQFSRSQWSSFLLLLKATILDNNRIWLTFSLDSMAAIDFLYAAQNQDLYFCGLNFIVSLKFLEALRNKKSFEVIGEHISSLEKVDADQVLELIERLRSKGGKVRFIFREAMNWNDVPALGSRSVILGSGLSLIPGEAVPECSLNLVKMLKRVSGQWELSWEKMADRIHNVVRLLDDMIELNDFPVREVYEITRRTRRVSLKLAGWAKMLCYLGLPYDSEATVELANKLSAFVKKEANNASWTLARERGVFPSYRGSELEKNGLKRRNASVFSGVVDVRPMNSLKTEEVFSWFDEVSRRRGFYSEELFSYIEKKGSIRELEYLPDDIKRIFVVEDDIELTWQLKLQSTFQESCDGFVDLQINTHNLSADLLWKANLFGSAGFSTNEFIVVSQNNETTAEAGVDRETNTSSDIISVSEFEVKDRPEVLFGSTVKVETGCGSLRITINQDDKGRLREILLTLEKSNGCVGAHLEAISHLLSLLVSTGLDVSYVIKALKDIKCSAIAWNKGKQVFSCADAIAQVLSERFKKDARDNSKINLEDLNSDLLRFN